MKIVVIGGVAAGMSAASKAKRSRPDADVLVLERGDQVSYGACGLPYYVGGLNQDPEKMLIRRAEEFKEQDIDVRVGCEVTALDAAAKQLAVRDVRTGEQWQESYDRLMIATGADAIRPKLPGIDLPGVHLLKTYTDGLALRSDVQKGGRVVVAGGGAIGVEVAENLRRSGADVTIIEAAPGILGPFDPEIREKLQAQIEKSGIALRLSEPIQEIVEKNGRAAAVRTEKGEYPADVVVMALGVRPATGFLAGSGIALAKNGAIEVDRQQRTSLPDVWAAGDCAMVYSRIEERNVYLALGTVANKCGRIAGGNIAGGALTFDGCLGSAAIKVCGWEAGRTGMGEKAAREQLGDVSVAFIETFSHPEYYPGQTPLWVKLICEAKSGRIVGGQLVGEQGAVLRVDALAAAITGGLTAEELGMADFCYAPPFANVWDALNIAGNAVK